MIAPRNASPGQRHPWVRGLWGARSARLIARGDGHCRALSRGMMKMERSWLVAGVLLAALAVPAPVAYGQPPSGETTARLREDRIACAPTLGVPPSDEAIRLVGSEEGVGQSLYAPRDALVFDAGLDAGLQVGQEFFVRRLLRPVGVPASNGVASWLRHTAGWVRIVATEQRQAVAVLVRACDGLLQGDFLEPFAMPVAPAVLPPGQPDYEGAGVVLSGQDGATSVGPGHFIVISLGGDNGIEPGQRLSLFRESFGGSGAVAGLGEAVVVLVGPASATAQVLRSRDAIFIGDGAAPQR